ncbi:MAG: type 4a pilus biogenesis protein PilO [Acidimicrobiia bacterium]
MKRNTILAVVAGALVVILIWFFAFYKPKGDEVSKTNDEVATAERQQQDLDATLAQLQALDKERPQQQATLDKLNAAIPATPDLAEFIFEANTAAAESGVDWLSIAPTPPVASATGGPSEIVLNIQVQGGFFQVLDYLNRLENLKRLVVTDTVNLSAGGTDTSGSAGSTTETTLSTSTSDSGAPTLSVTLGAKMYTSATVAPAAPGATPAPTPAPATQSSGTGVS